MRCRGLPATTSLPGVVSAPDAGLFRRLAGQGSPFLKFSTLFPHLFIILAVLMPKDARVFTEDARDFTEDARLFSQATFALTPRFRPLSLRPEPPNHPPVAPHVCRFPPSRGTFSIPGLLTVLVLVDTRHPAWA